MSLLRPSAKILTKVAAPLGHAFAVGTVNVRAAAALNAQLASSLQALELFSKNPLVLLGFEELTRTAELGTPLFAGLAPAQTNCNYITLAFRNLANLLSESIGNGTLARVVPILSPSGENNEGLPASAPANGTSNDVNVTTGKTKSKTTTCTTTPTRTSAGPASRRSAKRATSSSSPKRP